MKFYISACNGMYHVKYDEHCVKDKSIDDAVQSVIYALNDSMLEIYYHLSNEIIQYFRVNWQNSYLLRYCVKNAITVKLLPVIKDESIWVSNRFANESVSVRYYYKGNQEDFYCRRFYCSSAAVDWLCFYTVETLRKELGHVNSVTVQTESLFNIFQQNGYQVKMNSFNRELYNPSEEYFSNMWSEFYSAIHVENVQNTLNFINHGLYTKLSCIEYNQLLEGVIPQSLREVVDG